MARTVFETAAAADVGAVILELARSEQTYTFQRPTDYATAVLAGAIAAGWQGPVFLQGDHYQFNAKKYAADPEAMTEEIRRACRLAIDAGYRNIDIDSSTLVDLSKPTLDEQQRENYARAAELTALIRSLETDGVTISVGGEIGEVGKKNSTEAELRAYLDGLSARARRAGAGRDRHQQGQRPDRHVARRRAAAGRRRSAEVKLDFEVHRRLGEVARELRPGGHRPARRVDAAGRAVPPLPGGRDGRDPPRDRLPEPLYEHPAFPAEMHEEIEAWCFENALDERKPDQTDEQFVYTTRKKAIGPFKRELWDLATKDEILAAQRRKIALPVHGARRERLARDGRALHPAGPSSTGRCRTPCARQSQRRRRGRSRRTRVRGRARPTVKRTGPEGASAPTARKSGPQFGRERARTGRTRTTVQQRAADGSNSWHQRHVRAAAVAIARRIAARTCNASGRLLPCPRGPLRDRSTWRTLP